MTVSELISELEDLNPEMEVSIDDEDLRTVPVTYVSTEIRVNKSGEDERVAILSYIDLIKPLS